MKRNFKYLIPLLLLVVSMASCKKYLDIQRSNSDKFIETAEDCQLLLDRYSIMNTNYPGDGQASSDDTYLGTNVYPGQYSPESKDLYTWQPGAIRASSDPQWVKPYQTVYFANLVLETIDNIKSSTDPAVYGNVKGSALFFRAYALWNVAQLYAKPYGPTASTDPGIPARTSSDINDHVGRGTVQDTYNRILQDLNEAAGLLPDLPTVSSRPSKVAAFAMLARVYLSMEDYPNALTNASASLAIKNTLLAYSNISITSPIPFSRFNAEVLFHTSLAAPGQASDQILHPGTAGAPRARVNDALYAQYDINDLRKNIFFKANTGTFAGTYRFTGSYEPTSGANVFNGLAVDEVYLTRAECYARAGKTTEAMADLNTLLASRWKANTFVPLTAATADDALARIVLERRKELVLRALRWTDLRRLNKDPRFSVKLTRTVTEGNPAVTTTYELPANDPRYVLLIPIEVINNTGMPQNQR